MILRTHDSTYYAPSSRLRLGQVLMTSRLAYRRERRELPSLDRRSLLEPSYSRDMYAYPLKHSGSAGLRSVPCKPPNSIQPTTSHQPSIPLFRSPQPLPSATLPCLQLTPPSARRERTLAPTITASRHVPLHSALPSIQSQMPSHAAFEVPLVLHKMGRHYLCTRVPSGVGRGL